MLASVGCDSYLASTAGSFLGWLVGVLVSECKRAGVLRISRRFCNGGATDCGSY